jgi:hypothetical protein
MALRGSVLVSCVKSDFASATTLRIPSASFGAVLRVEQENSVGS